MDNFDPFDPFGGLSEQERDAIKEGMKFLEQLSRWLRLGLLYSNKMLAIAIALVLLLAISSLVKWAYRAPADSFAQSFAIEISAGTVFFVLFVLILDVEKFLFKRSIHVVWMLPTVLFLGSTILGILAYNFEGSPVTRSFLIEGSAGLLLLMVLDVVIANVIKLWGSLVCELLNT